MKNLLTATLPALALLALGGCASTAGLATSEDDGVYYNSSDHTTAVAPASGYGGGYQGHSNGGSAGNYNQPTPAQTQTDEAANPDYNGNTGTTQSGNSTQYYDDNAATNGNGAYNQGYNNRYNNGRSSSIFRSPYAGPGVAYYAPPMYAPYTVIAVPSYGWGGGYCGFSSFGGYGYDPFYSGFYGPGYGYGSGFSISFGYGFGGGYGYGRPYGWGSPYGGFYDPYWGGYYGGRGYGYSGGYYGNGYGGGYYGGRNVRYIGNANGGGNYDGGGRTVNVGPRTDRWTTGGRAANPAGTTRSGDIPMGTNAGGGRRVFKDEVLAPGGTGSIGASPTTQAEIPGGKRGGNRPTQIENYQFSDVGQPVKNQQPTTLEPNANGGGRRWQANEQMAGYGQPTNQPAMQPATQPEAKPQYGETPQGGGRRGGFFGQSANDNRSNENRSQGFDRPQRTYEQPQRTYEQPQRNYEQPQRSYEQPSRGGGFGGGNPGGGSPGGGGGGGRRGGGGMN